MNALSDSRGMFHWTMATLTAVALTALLVWTHANATTAGMVFLVLVVWSAAQAGIWLSVYVAVLCAVVFDFFFLLPFHTIHIAGVQQWLAMISFVASCVVAGRLAERARRQTAQAEQRRDEVERLYTLSQEMMLHEEASTLARELPRMIQRILALDAVVLYVRDPDQLYASTSDLPMSIRASLAALPQGHGQTTVVPGEITAMALTIGMRTVGGLGWRPDILSRELATAVSAQVAIALTRALAIEASARLEAAREGERLRTALIDSITHELRTPLTSIRAAATTLMQGEGLDDAARLDLATVVDEEASRLDKLIGEAVEMAEIDAHVVQVNLQQRHTRAFLEDAVQHSQMALAQHRVVIDVQEPDMPAWFDPHLLGRVLRHLLENAARYSPPGSKVVLRTRRIADRLEFAVEDNGPGIEGADLPFVFEKFYRGKKGAVAGKGTGMGLAIVRAILTAHGGSIEVASAPGQGTSFRFWVPLLEKEPDRKE